VDESELLALIEQEEANCLSTATGKLAEQRRQALQYYFGEPYGNEVEGRSQVVTTEVKDAVEGMMPSLMAIFTSSDEIVRFEAQSPKDEAQAQQATDYLNYLFTRQNNGFTVLYCLFKDALLLKNGFAKVYWEDYEDNGKESYEGLTDMEFVSLMQDPELTLVSHTENPPEQGDYQQPPQPGQPPQPPQPTHDAVFRRSKKYGKICIDPVPPEEVLVSRETPNDGTLARFKEHRRRTSISQIREMGYKIDDDIADYAPNAEFNMERFERNRFDDAWAFTPDQPNNADPTTREVWLCQAYLFVDYDKDGIAEFRRVTKVGRTVLENIEFDSDEIVGGTAIPFPHKYYGLSVHDLVGDIQLIKSVVTRQLLDNAYNANNGRYAVLDNMVNMDDLLTSRPNGIVRMKTLGAVSRLDTPLLGAPTFGLLEYLDKIKTNRVGATDFPNAVDPDAINSKATFVEAYRNAALERINLMARCLAEGPVKAIFWKMLELVSKHQQKPLIVKLRGQWVQMDPREWKDKFHLTVTVGLGTGSQQQLTQGAMQIMQVQQGLMQAGMFGTILQPANVYAACDRLAKGVFPKDHQMFFTDPSTVPPQQPRQDPKMMQLQLQNQWKQMGDAQKRDKMAQDAQQQELDRKFEAQSQQFQALQDQLQATRDHMRDMEARNVDQAHEHGQTVADVVREERSQQLTAHLDNQQKILQALIDSIQQGQKDAAEHARLITKGQQDIAAAQLRPKELVKEGGRKIVRPVA
jgi:hypothetical protein